ncbi:hypothetical protein MtrunA17_Chr4g0060481 [Medicago truncatula]|uniref:Uncharacterized protein n=1 Tax=Medicago truncatula TaxID=3880 RepID=A0A396IDL2_MEDTR|nr:hypothetical protein MtrunA17_Chr4g0060481 [Medicago truncatula]
MVLLHLLHTPPCFSSSIQTQTHESSSSSTQTHKNPKKLEKQIQQYIFSNLHLFILNQTNLNPQLIPLYL